MVGLISFGVVGGAIAGVTGKDRKAVMCLDCGALWCPADVYAILQAVKKESGITLDLSIERHRLYVDKFAAKLAPYIADIIPKSQAKADQILTSAENDLGPGGNLGLFAGIIALVASFILGIRLGRSWDASLILSLAPFVLCFVAGGFYDYKKGWSHSTHMKRAKEESDAVLDAARAEIRIRIRRSLLDANLLSRSSEDPMRKKYSSSPAGLTPPPPPPPL